MAEENQATHPSNTPLKQTPTRVEQYQETLKDADFTDQKSINKIAAGQITSKESAEEFKTAYDNVKPNDVPEWDHKDSVTALNTAAGNESFADNVDSSRRLAAQASLVNKELVEVNNKATRPGVSAVDAAKDQQKENDNEATERQNASTQTTAQTQAANSETVKVVAAPRETSSEQVEQIGTINGAQIKARPEELDNKYVIQNSLGGKGSTEKYLLKGTENEAFRDTGKSIVVKPEARTLVAEDVAKLADSKGWTEIKVSGSNQFRRDIWKEANLRGIEVQGYKPTEQDKRDLDRRLDSVEAAPRDNQSKKENQAIAPKATATIGDRASANPEVKPPEAQRREELQKAFDDKNDIAGSTKRFPELKELYSLEKAATQFAATRIDGLESQSKFVGQITNRGLDELSKGNKLPQLKPAAIQPSKGLPGVGR